VFLVVNACYRRESVDREVKAPNFTCVAGVLALLLSISFMATAQQNKPWESKLCFGWRITCSGLYQIEKEWGQRLPNSGVLNLASQTIASFRYVTALKHSGAGGTEEAKGPLKGSLPFLTVPSGTVSPTTNLSLRRAR
jgi:hypothetical protein